MNEGQDMVLVVNGRLARQEALAGGMLSSRRTIPTIPRQIILLPLMFSALSTIFSALFPDLCF